MKKQREYKIMRLLLACILVVYTCLAAASLGRQQIPRSYFQQQQQAAQLLADCFQQVKGYKEALGLSLHPLDYHQTGMIGDDYTGITTTLGSIEAKRTTACPDMAALCVRLLQDAGVRPGDTVAANFSGSFPAMNLAVIAACQVMEVQLVYTSSVGASTYGANQPELTFPEMAHRLVEDGLLYTDSAAVSLGGDGDIGGSMDPQLVDQIVSRLEAAGLPLIQEADFSRNLAIREALYHSQGAIRCFVSVGGNLTSLGLGEEGITLGQGLLTRSRSLRLTEESGLVQRYLAQGVPVINLLNIKKLMADYGMPFDPDQWPQTGTSPIYHQIRYPYPPILLGMTAAAALAVLCAYVRNRGGRSGIPSPDRIEHKGGTSWKSNGTHLKF